MEIVISSSTDELNLKGAEYFEKLLAAKPDAVLGLATGSTPIGIYNELIRKYRAGRIDFSRAKAVNLDEYIGLSPDDNQSYANFMQQKLFSQINIQPGNCYIPNGTADDIDAECQRYDRVIASMGGIDIQLLGIGHDGHIGFNEPGHSFEKQTHSIELTKETIAANARFFESMEKVPKRAITMGIKAIMNAKSILLVAFGADKCDIVYRALTGPITPSVPSSILQLHPNLTVLLDDSAGAKLR